MCMRFILRLLAVAGLTVDAYMHIWLAPQLASDSTLDGELLFQIQGGVAAVVALLLLVHARRWTYALSFLVLAGALGALLVYRYVDVGVLGPLPNLYDPLWYRDKAVTAAGEAVGTVAALIGVFVGARRRDEDEDWPEPHLVGARSI